MTIIFSRKGFDSTRSGSESPNGGVSSPIFPDGTALSLPIPQPGSPTRYGDVQWRGESLGPIVESLSNRRRKDGCHLDPDLNADALARLPGWRPAFGQSQAAQSHLKNEGVGPGDLFLFFGTFQRVEEIDNDGWCFVRTAPKVHMIFGWLQVHKVLPLHTDADYDYALRKYPWLSDHPHLHESFKERALNLRKLPNNTVYVSTPELDIGGIGLPGGGVFQNEHGRIILTDPEEVDKGNFCRPSYWRLPSWFYRPGGCPILSYHGNKRHWRRREPWVYLKTVSPGQEFVFDTGGIPEAHDWLLELFE